MADTEFPHYYDKESTAIIVEFRGQHIATPWASSLANKPCTLAKYFDSDAGTMFV
jgi:hypothetical protein